MERINRGLSGVSGTAYTYVCKNSRFQFLLAAVKVMVGLTAAGLLVSCSCGKTMAPGPETEAHSHKVVRLQLPWTMQAQFAGPIVAARPAGPYERRGLRVDLVEGGFTVNAPVEVASGNADFGILQPDQLIYFDARNNDQSKHLRAVAVIFGESMTCFMVRHGSGIRDFADFRGKRVGIKEGTNVHNEFKAVVAKAGLDLEDDMDLVPVQWDLGLFINGSVDVFPGFSINEPFQARKAGLEVELLRPAQSDLKLYGDVLVTRQELILESPDIVRAVVEGTLEGWREAVSNPGEAIALILEHDSLLQTDHQEFMLNASRSLLSPLRSDAGRSSREVWEEMVNLLVTYGDLEEGSVKPENLYTNTFVPSASETGAEN